MRRPTFSVLVTTYERPALLAKAMQSVQAQTFEDFECLVVDDGGRCDLPPPPDQRFRFIRLDTNVGKAAALNVAIEEARGHWLTFLDDDDLYSPARLSNAVSVMGVGPLSVCAIGTLGKGRGSHVPVRRIALEYVNGGTMSLGCTAVLRDRCHPLNPGYRACEDAEWWLRLPPDTPVGGVDHVDYIVRPHAGARHGNGLDARITFSQRLLDDHRTFYARHRRAHGARLRRLGLLAMQAGDRELARSSFRASLARWPSARSAKHLVRATHMGPHA